MVFILLWIIWIIIGSVWYLSKESDYNYVVNEIDKRIEEFERKKAKERRREYRKAKGIILKENLSLGSEKQGIKLGGIEI